MKMKVMVLCEARNEFVNGKGVLVKDRQLEMHDCEAHLDQRIPGSFTYTMSDEEKSNFPPGSLDGKVIEIGVARIDAHNGKVKVRGALPRLEPVAKKAA